MHRHEECRRAGCLDRRAARAAAAELQSVSGPREHPELERLADRRARRTAAERCERRGQNSIRARGFRLLGGERLGQFEHVTAEREASEVVAEVELRQLGRLRARDKHELAVRPAPKVEHHVREGFELALEAHARFARALGDSAELAVLAREQRDDPIGFGVVARAQRNRRRYFLSGHDPHPATNSPAQIHAGLSLAHLSLTREVRHALSEVEGSREHRERG